MTTLHSCQVSDHSYMRTHRRFNTAVMGCPSPGQQITEMKDQRKEDTEKATAKKFRSFGLEVST